jgi:DNA-binding beta-propeller fold protein YncE
MGEAQAVSFRRSLFIAAVAATLAGCEVPPPDRIRAGDAGFVYEPLAVADAASPRLGPPLDRPSVRVLAGRAGGRGDLDGVGVEARLGLVGGLVRVGDAVVFADEGNGSLRSFAPATAAVETLARLPPPPGGGPALPAFVAYDGKARLFVTDRASSVVYAFDTASRALSVLAGRPGRRGDADGKLAYALFDTPTGLAFDGSGALYVADVGGRSLRRIDIARGEVTTVARGFSQLWGLCFSGQRLYATDNLASTVLEINASTGASAAIAGSDRFGYAGSKDGIGQAAHFREPRGIACDPETVYVADRGNGLVRALDRATHAVRTVAGYALKFGVRDGQRDAARFDDVQALLRWGDSLYVGDEASLRTVSIGDGATRTVAGAPPWEGAEDSGISGEAFRRPSGLALVAPEAAAYVADCLTSSVRRVDLGTLSSSVFAGDLKPLVFVDDLKTRGGFVDGPWDRARFRCPSALAYDGRGNLFVADRDNHAVRDVELASRHVITLAGDPGRCGNRDGPLDEASFCDPAALAFSDGALFVADAATATIRRVDPTSRTVTTIAGRAFDGGWVDGAGPAARFAAPSSLAARGSTLFVADTGNHVIRSVDTRTGTVATVAGKPGQRGDADGPFADVLFDAPRALATVGADDLLVFDRHAVHRLSLRTRSSVRVIEDGKGLRTGSVSPQLAEPTAVADIGDGAVLVVDSRENVLVFLSYPP